MKLTIFTLAFLTVVLSFLTSGTENLLLGSGNYVLLPLWAHFVSWSLILLLLGKIIFKKVRYFRRSVYRNLIRFNRLFGSIPMSFASQTELNSLQEKVINNWNDLLKDPKSNLDCSIKSYTRVIHNNDISYILRSSLERTLTIIGTGDKNIFYEVYIPQTQVTEMSNNFDKVKEEKLSKSELKSRKIIEDLL